MTEREQKSELWCERGGYWVTPEFVEEQQCPYWECCQCECSTNCRAAGEGAQKDG